jgi:hypothetical protein
MCRYYLSGQQLKPKQIVRLSNSGRPFDYIVKAGQTARPKTKE